MPPCSHEKYEKPGSSAWTREKSVKEKTMSPGFDRPSRRVAIKNCRTFRCRGSTIVSRSYSISFPLFFTFSSLFFSSFCIEQLRTSFHHTEIRIVEPIVSKLAKSRWKNRTPSISTLSLPACLEAFWICYLVVDEAFITDFSFFAECCSNRRFRLRALYIFIGCSWIGMSRKVWTNVEFRRDSTN